MSLELASFGLQLGGNLYSAFSGMDMWSSEQQRLGRQIEGLEGKKSDIKIAGEKQKEQLVDVTSEQQTAMGNKYGNIFEQINQEAASLSSQTGFAHGSSDVAAKRKQTQARGDFNIASEQSMSGMQRGLEGIRYDVDDQIKEANRMIEVLQSQRGRAQSMSGDFLANFFG